MSATKSQVLIPEDAVPHTEKNYITVNSALLDYSKQWNREFTLMSNEADELLDAANNMNVLTGNFNLNLYQINVDLDSILKYIANHPEFGI